MEKLTIWSFLLAVVAGLAWALGAHILDIIWPHKQTS